MRIPYVTYLLLMVNVLVFVALAINLGSLSMNTAADSLKILYWGSNINPLTLGGEPWRILTSMFLHVGIWHLLLNMYGLYSLGIPLEKELGPIRFILIYFCCGVVAALFSLALNVFVSSAGASGAIFGLYGYSLGALLISDLSDARDKRRMMISFVIFMVVSGLIALMVNVDLWGHIGGFAGGVVLAVLQLRLRLLVKSGSLALALVGLVTVIFVLPKDQVRHYRLFQQVLQQERTTNGYYQHELSDAELLDSLRRAVAAWDSIGMRFNMMGPVRATLQHDSAVLRQFAKLHRAVTEYRVSLLAKQSYTYLDSIEITNARFDSVPAVQYNLDYFPREDNVKTTASDTTDRAKLTPRRVFYDGEWREINDPSAALFYRIGQADSAGRWQGPVRDYYRSGDIQMKGNYIDNLKDGVFLYYSDHGTYSSAGRYQREEAVGKWENFHWNGKLQTETYYNDKAYVATIFDSLGREQVTGGHGTVTSWHSNGTIAETGQYENGMRTGDWLGFHPSGAPYYREQFRENRLVQGAAVDVAGKRYVYDQLSLYAYPVKGMGDFEQYVRNNIRRPDPNSSGARIRVLFQVGKEGDMWDFVILEGLTADYEQEAIRLIREGPAWRPGLLHGHVPVPSQGYAVITF